MSIAPLTEGEPGPGGRNAWRDQVLCALVPHAVHRLGNLLTVVMGAAELLAMDERNDGRVKELEGISNQARRAVDLIRALGGHARTQAGPPMAIDLADSVRAVEELMSPVAKSVGLPLTLGPGAGITVVRADPGGVQLALVGLLVEALDAEQGLSGRDGETHLRAVELGSRAGILARLVVREGGALRAFEPSTQARTLVDSLGASLRVRPYPNGAGLAFLLSFPGLS